MAKKFLTDINIAGGVYDSSGDIGSSGQVLSSTGSGINWIDANSAASVVYQDGFTGNGSTTAFTLANSIDNENKTQVYIDGVYQHKDNYSLSGTTLTFSTAPPNTSDIEVISFGTVSSADDILYDTDFSSAGLMTTNGSGVYSITTNNSSNWNTAYTYSQVGHLPLAGGTLTGNLQLNDNVNLNIGTGSDLEIYHNGSHCYITNDTGNFNITSTGSLILEDANALKWMMTNQGGSVLLYYNGASKLTTTSSGVTVTGGVLIGNDEFYKAENTSGTSYKIAGITSGNVIQIGAIDYTSAGTVFAGGDNISITTGGASGTIRIKVASSGNVGIGTTSPDAKLSLYHATDDVSINVNTGTGGSYPKKTGISFGATSTSLGGDSEFKGGAGIQAINTAASNNPTNLAFWTTSGGSPTERMRIDSSGNVGIGTSSPSDYNASARNLVVYSTGNTGITIASNNTSSDGTIRFADGTGGTAGYRGSIQYSHGGDFMNFNTAALERMRIDSSGNVGIGTTSPASLLHIQGSTYNRVQTYFSGSYTSGFKFSDLNGGIWYDAGADDLYLNANHANSQIILQSGGSTTLTLDASNNATFAGDVYVTGTTNSNVVISRDNMYLDAGQFYIGADDSVTDDSFRQRTASGSYFIESRKSGTWTNRLQINSAGTLIAGQGATFAGTIQSDDITIVDGTNDINLYLANTSYGIQLDYSAGDMFFRTNGGTRLTIANGGNVGIGTTTPAAKLTIGDPGGNTTRSIQVEGNNSASGMNGTIGYFANGLYISNNYYYSSAQVHPVSTYGQTSIVQQTSTTTGGNFIDFNVSDHTDSNNAPDTRMRILDDGKVGIGTTAPEGRLDVTGNIWLNSDNANAAYYLRINRGQSQDGGILLYGNKVLDWQLVNLANRDLNWYSYSTGSSVMRLTSAGNLGIGTTSPAEKLRVQGNSGSDLLVRFQPFTNNAQTKLYLSSVSSGDGGYFYDANNNESGLFAYGDYTFYVGTSNISGSIGNPRMIIKQGGNVGIGTTSPDYQLDIENSSHAVLRLHAGVNSSASLRLKNDAQDWDLNTQTTDTFAIYNQTSGTQPFSILTNGNVGIGTTSPAQLLQINGAVYATLGLYSDHSYSGNRNWRFITNGFGNAAWGGLALRTSTGAGLTPDTTRFGIDYLGNVGIGIGEQSPAEKLEVNGNIKAADTTGVFYSNLYTVTTASTVDTFSNSGAGLWEYIIRINPNPAGSGSYTDFYYGKLGIGTGWSGSNVTDYIWYQEDQTAPRNLYPSGGGNKTISFVMVSGGSEVTSVNAGTTVTIRVKGFGGNSYSQNISVFFRRLA